MGSLGKIGCTEEQEVQFDERPDDPGEVARNFGTVFAFSFAIRRGGNNERRILQRS